MIVDFNGETISYNSSSCAKVEKDNSVTVDLGKLNFELACEFHNDAEAFRSVLRAHGYRGCSVIMPEWEADIPCLRQDFEELGFTILENPDRV